MDFPQEKKNKVFQRPCSGVLLLSQCLATTIVHYTMTVVFLVWQGP